jgi:hypothetical protein
MPKGFGSCGTKAYTTKDTGTYHSRRRAGILKPSLNKKLTHKPGRLYAEIHSEANNETFWLSYCTGANFLLGKFTATADTSSTIIWRDGTLAQVRESQNKQTAQ